jgi:hypothetical protein
VRNFRTAQRAALPAAAAVLGALVAGPAFADVTVSPATAVQCSGENLYFTVTNDGAQAIRTIKLDWPADTPVAEVYPLSVDDWAPKIDMQTLTQPLTTIHGGTPVTETAKSITWLAMPGRELGPGKSTKLGIAIGPLPTVSSMQFTAATTYVDGKAGPAMPAEVGLTPAVDCQAAGHAGHTGTDATGTTGGSAAEDRLFSQVVSDASRGPAVWSLSGWVLAALMLIGGLVYFLRGRHRAEEDDEPDDEDRKQTDAKNSAAETTEPVAAGKWSFRG